MASYRALGAIGFGVAALLANGAACSSSGSDNAAKPDAATPDEDAPVENPGPPCPANGIAKGPWALGMTRTSVLVR